MRRKGARLGQHFLTGVWAARKLAESVHIRKDETILEIGPGKGALTGELLKTGARVVAIEKDGTLMTQLHKMFAREIASGHLTLVEGDIRDFDPRSSKLEARSYSVAANIPYYITGEIIRKFLTAKPQPRAIALLIQKEVAERITSDKESILSISVKVYGTPKIVTKVSRGNFSPPPSVDSAILLISSISRKFFREIDENFFFEVVRGGFSSKRKLLIGNLVAKLGYAKSRLSQAFKTCDIPEKARAENVAIEKWKCLVRKLTVNRKQ